MHKLELVELCEVLDGANHLARVGVLVVVPRNDLYLVGVVVDLSDHGLRSIEQRAVTHADHVGGYDLVGVGAEGLGRAAFIAALMPSTVTSLPLTTATRMVVEPVQVGTR